MLEEVLILDVSPSGECNPVRKKFCGFEWEAEAAAKETFLQITLWCNRSVEGNLWRCSARVMAHTSGVDGSQQDALRKVSFSEVNRSVTIEVPKSDIFPKKIEIRFELFDISGYRDPAMYQIDFSKPSPNSNVCFSFDKSDVRLYSNKDYLGVHSDRMRQLFLQLGKGLLATSSISSRMSDFGDDFDVLSLHSDTSAIREQSMEKDEVECDGICFLVQDYSSDAHALKSMANSENAECEHIKLKNVEPDDFLVLLRAIYPPFAVITEENVKKLLAMAYQFGVEHIVCKCEQYFLNEDGNHSLDLLQSLELAMSYKMAELQNECLRRMKTAAEVRELLDDPRLVSAPREMRQILLETLLRRLKSDLDVQKSHNISDPPQNLGKNPKRSFSAASTGAQNLVYRLFESVGLTDKKLPTLYSINSTTNISENTFIDTSKKPVQKKSMPIISAEVASRKKEVAKQEGIRKNLEFSLKCYREFIGDVEKKAIAEAEATSRGSVDQAECSEVKSLSSSSTEKLVPPPRRAKPLRAENQNFDFLKNLVFDTFNACKLCKDRIIIVGCTRALSAHDIFSDLVLPPYTLMKNVLYSFVTHTFSKLYGDKIVQIVRSHFSQKVDAFPDSLAEQVAGAIIGGYELRKQLDNDDLLVHELRVYLVKQLKKNFNEFVENIKVGYFPNSFS